MSRQFYYFAYGSNMLTERLCARCSSARPIGQAEVEGFDIEFTKPSEDGSGKANLRSATGADRTSQGVVFAIDQSEQAALDAAEGVGVGYNRIDSLAVRLRDRDTRLSAATYIATEPQPGLIPYDWYLALVIAGAWQHHLEPEYVARLSSIPYTQDRYTDRRTRREALRALEESGFGNYEKLLTGRP